MTEFTAQERKERPLATGVLDYFPDALTAVAHCSWVGNNQHNPGQPLHWAKEKSTDHADALLRHLKDRGKLDTDGVRHSAKVAWRALALLQTEIEHDAKWPPAPAPITQEELDRLITGPDVIRAQTGYKLMPRATSDWDVVGVSPPAPVDIDQTN